MPRGYGPRLKSRKDRADYENRLRIITRMAIREVTEGEIAIALGIDQATVSRDLDEIRKRNFERFYDDHQAYKENLVKLLAKMDMHFNEVERQLWAEANSEKNAPQTRVAALRAIREIWTDKIDFLLRFGFITPAQTNKEPVNYEEFLEQIEARRKSQGRELIKSKIHE